MEKALIDEIQTLNPWLDDPGQLNLLNPNNYIPRAQTDYLMKQEWDELWLILVGPRQSGKTTLGRHLCYQLIQQQRYQQLLYLNCDIKRVRDWLANVSFINNAKKFFGLEDFILFIDEVQRLDSPGLLLKAIYDLKLPIKLIASGSSQLEIKSKVQEHLTGRHLEATILPFNSQELPTNYSFESQLIFGCYPQIVAAHDKSILLKQLYSTYINKDIIEILKMRNADLIENLTGLIAHSSGQLVNYQQLATDCKTSTPTVQHYLSILEKTYVIQAVKPFVGNKRQELTSNPIYYYIDNGFRNQSLNNFTDTHQRTDLGLLVENFVFQSLLKYQTQNFKTFKIHYWRTKGGAEIDFVIYKNADTIIPIEVKYRTLTSPKLTRGYRSFIDSYQPQHGLVITKDYYAEQEINGCKVIWLPVDDMQPCFQLFDQVL